MARLPEWLRRPETRFHDLHRIKTGLRQLGLHTVCESARCPNIHACFGRGTATFLLLGDRCTRRCGFCAVPGAENPCAPGAPDPLEPAHVAHMASQLGLEHVVLTSVTRDDLPDGGAAHFASTVEAVRRALPEARIEVLTPDFQGNPEAIRSVLESRPAIFNHNLETVERLYAIVRPQAVYQRSLEVLRQARAIAPDILTKSGLMAGLGEEPEEVEAALGDLREAGVSIVTIGQYLAPSRAHLAVARHVGPAEFDAWREYALRLGFRAALCGPLVRSSYLADETALEAVC